MSSESGLQMAPQSISSIADSWTYATTALLATGFLIRVALVFPLSAFPADSDGVAAGLTAFKILEGQLPVFLPGGFRSGPLSSYVAAGFFALIGPGRIGLALTSVALGLLFLASMSLLLYEVLGRTKPFLVALLFTVLPPTQFLIVTYVPWGYQEIMTSAAITLWLAMKWRHSHAKWKSFLFGLSSGFGLWLSLETLMVSLPAAVWLLFQGRKLRELPIAIAGAVAGFSPWLVYNLLHGFPSIYQDYVISPAAGLGQMWSNLWYCLVYNLPTLFASGYSPSGSDDPWGLANYVIVASYAVIATGYLLSSRKSGIAREQKDLWVLFLLIWAATLGFYAASEAGSTRGWTVRYVIPVYVLLPLMLSICVTHMGQFSKIVPVIAAAVLLCCNFMLYPLPGTAARLKLQADLVRSYDLIAFSRNRHIETVFGDHWMVQYLNFDSNGELKAIPIPLAHDYYNYRAHVSQENGKWALVGKDSDDVNGLAAWLGVKGDVLDFGGLTLLIPTDSVLATYSAKQVVAKLR